MPAYQVEPQQKKDNAAGKWGPILIKDTPYLGHLRGFEVDSEVNVRVKVDNGDWLSVTLHTTGSFPTCPKWLTSG